MEKKILLLVVSLLSIFGISLSQVKTEYRSVQELTPVNVASLYLYCHIKSFSNIFKISDDCIIKSPSTGKASNTTRNVTVNNENKTGTILILDGATIPTDVNIATTSTSTINAQVVPVTVTGNISNSRIPKVIRVTPAPKVDPVEPVLKGEKGDKGDIGPQGPAGSVVYIPITATPTPTPADKVTQNDISYSSSTNRIVSNVNGVHATTTIDGLYNARLAGTTTAERVISNNIFSNIANLISAYVTNLFADNITATTTNTANLASTNATTTNLTVQNLNTNNTLSSSNNVMTSNVGGSVGTTSIIRTNSITTNGTTLTTSINGVSTSTDLANLVASSTSNTLTISTSSNSFILTSIVNGKVATTTGTLIDSNTLSSAANVLTNTINGLSASTTIINSNSINANNGVVTTNINGVIATTSLTSLYTFLASSTNSNLTVATTTDGKVTYILSDAPIFSKVTTTDLVATNGTTTNFFSNLLTAVSGYFTSLFADNITATTTNTQNLTATGNTNLATTTISNAIIGNFNQLLASNTTNAVDYAGGVFTSTVNGVIATTSITGLLPVTTNDISYSSTTNKIVSTVNGMHATTTIDGLSNMNLSGTTTAENIIANNATITNSTSTNLYTTNFATVNSTSTNLYATNLTADNATTTNLQTTNLLSDNIFTNIANLVSAYITNLFADNITATTTNTTNLVATNATATNFVSTNSTSTNLFSANATITSLSVQNLDTNNTLSSSNNVMTSNVGGSVGTTTIINNNSLVFSSSSNQLLSNINGIVSTTSFSEMATTSISNLLVGTTTPLSGKVAVFDGDVKVTGVLDPTALLFSDGITNSFDPAANDAYKIDFAFRNLAFTSNANPISNPTMYLGQNGNVGIGATSTVVVASTNSSSSPAQQLAKLSVYGGDMYVNGMTFGLGGGQDSDSIALGSEVLFNNTTGFGNTAVGQYVMTSNTTGYNNSAFGLQAMYNNTEGYENTAFGNFALFSNTIGNHNSAFGSQALSSIASGNNNLALGYFSAGNLYSGDNNIAIGKSTDFASSTGSNQLNIGNLIFGLGLNGSISNPAGFIGIGTSTPDYKFVVAGTSSLEDLIPSGPYDGNLSQYSVGSSNARWANMWSNIYNIGSSTWSIGQNDDTGRFVIFDGPQKTGNERFNISLAGNVGIGTTTAETISDALSGSSPAQQLAKLAVYGGDMYLNGLTVGLGGGQNDSNTVMGKKALYSNTSGTNNVALGYNSLVSNTEGYNNVSIGYESLKSNTIGIDNIALGQLSLKNNVSGESNIALGSESLLNNLDGHSNIVAGSGAMRSNVSGSRNIALGNQSMFLNQGRSNNIAMGTESLYSNNKGDRNIGIGGGSLSKLGTSNDGTYDWNYSDNIAIGNRALQESFTFGSANVAIGNNSDIVAGGRRNVIIGDSSGSGGNDNVFIGQRAGSPEGMVNSNSSVAIGASAYTNGDYSIAIGSNASTFGNNKLNIGRAIFGLDINGYSGDSKIGIGTQNPNAKLDIDSDQQNVTGLRFSQVAFTPTISSIGLNANASFFASTDSGPGSIVKDSQGNFYSINDAGESITKATPQGVSSRFTTLGNHPLGAVIDSNDNIYVVNALSGYITKTDSSGNTNIYYDLNGAYVTGIAIDSQSNLYVSNSSANRVIKIDTNGNGSDFGTTGNWPQSLIVDDNGNVYVSSYYDRDVYKIDQAGNSQRVHNGNGQISSFAKDSTGNIYFAENGIKKVFKIDTSGNITEFGNTGNHPSGLLYDNYRNILYIANFDDNTFTRIYADGRNETIASSAMPTQMVMDSAGYIYYTADAGIMRLEVDSKPTYSKAVNKYLTVNDTGNVVLVDAMASLLASSTPMNGLTIYGGSVGLGGFMSTNTEIELNSKNLSFMGMGSLGLGTNSPGNKLEINASGSGLRFTNLKSTTTVATSTTKFLTVDENGDVVLANSSQTNFSSLTTNSITAANTDMSALIFRDVVNPIYDPIAVDAYKIDYTGRNLNIFGNSGSMTNPTMYMAQNGNVGIGTNNPYVTVYGSGAAKLTMKGHGIAYDEDKPAGFAGMSYGQNTPFYAGFKFRGTRASPSYPLDGDSLLQIIARDGIDGASAQLPLGPGGSGILMAARENMTQTAKGSDMSFYTTDIGSSTPYSRMAITPDGNVGIGNGISSVGPGAPATKLQVLGDIRVGDDASNGCLQNFSGTAIAGTCSSDERLKTDITPLTGVLSKIGQIQTVTYKWNGEVSIVNERKLNTNIINTGVIAQNVESVFPELVITDKDGYKQVNYTSLSMYMLSAISELASTSIKLGNNGYDMNANSINNVKSIASTNGKWSIDEEGRIKAKEIDVKKVETEEICVKGLCINRDSLQMMLNNGNIILPPSQPAPAPSQPQVNTNTGTSTNNNSNPTTTQDTTGQGSNVLPVIPDTTLGTSNTNSATNIGSATGSAGNNATDDSSAPSVPPSASDPSVPPVIN